MDADLEKSIKACEETIRDLPNRVQEYLEKLNQDTSQIDQFLKTNKNQDSQKIRQLQSTLDTKETERKLLEDKINLLENEYDNLQAEIEAAHMKNEIQRERIMQFDKQQALELQKTLDSELEKIDFYTKEISLYCNITQLRWDFEREDAVCGRILKNNQSEEFCIKPNFGEDVVSFRTVNEVWRILD